VTTKRLRASGAPCGRRDVNGRKMWRSRAWLK
jgi:hypothetical protein